MSPTTERQQAFDFAPKPEPEFDGADYSSERDKARLTGQIKRVYNLMKDGKFRSLRTIAAQTGDPEASVSAQLRHLRKKRFGSYVVIRARSKAGGSLYFYQLLDPEGEII